MTTTAPHTVRCNILGTLEIWADRHRIRLGGPIQERVLVTLLLEPGRVVPVTRLVQTVWDDDPPATAVHQIRKAVADLRRRIPEGASLVVTDGPGYRAVVDDDQLDLSRFHRLTAQARRDVAAGLTDQAADRLCEALALWRGSVMAGRGGAALTAAATALDERRLTATEQLYQLRLDRGEAGELIGDLRALVAEHPLCENLRGQLMLALYRSGRAAEALEEYGRARALLVEELGMDPGPRLTRLYEAILRDAEELAAPEQPAAPAPAPPAAPQPPAPLSPSTLPYDLTDFTGRERELGQLLAGAQRPSEGTRIVALDGMGGSGKTSLAVRASHQLAEAYPDGRLFINLRGYSPVEKPVQPSAALGALLRTLGVPDQRVPEDESGRTALWRATLAERRVLLLLDNALDAAQVLPLLPASPGCLVIVTSRARLVELDGAEWIHIGVMRPEDSTTLLAETLGDERAAAEPEAVAELAELCGQLPLALRIASARLCNRSRWTVQYLVDRLRDERRRLGELSAGDRSVAATIQLSYQMMEERHRTAFRLIGLHPGTDVDVQSVAALLGTDRWDAEDILERLLDVHLVQQQKMGRYGLHDLVRSFAQTLRTEGTAEADRAAVERVVDYYVAASEQACTVLFPGRARHARGCRRRRPSCPRRRTRPRHGRGSRGSTGRCCRRWGSATSGAWTGRPGSWRAMSSSTCICAATSRSTRRSPGTRWSPRGGWASRGRCVPGCPIWCPRTGRPAASGTVWRRPRRRWGSRVPAATGTGRPSASTSWGCCTAASVIWPRGGTT
ncbi:BTAD domain-containing putative transcriptional regulator [Streptomyces sp. UC1A3]